MVSQCERAMGSGKSAAGSRQFLSKLAVDGAQNDAERMGGFRGLAGGVAGVGSWVDCERCVSALTVVPVGVAASDAVCYLVSQ